MVHKTVVSIVSLGRSGRSISHLGYDPISQVLVAGFNGKNGTSFYGYNSVSQEQFGQLMSQPNETIGKYFRQHFVSQKLVHPYSDVTNSVIVNEDGNATMEMETEVTLNID